MFLTMLLGLQQSLYALKKRCKNTHNFRFFSKKCTITFENLTIRNESRESHKGFEVIVRETYVNSRIVNRHTLFGGSSEFINCTH